VPYQVIKAMAVIRRPQGRTLSHPAFLAAVNRVIALRKTLK
jgi:hypothetical protein